MLWAAILLGQAEGVLWPAFYLINSLSLYTFEEVLHALTILSILGATLIAQSTLDIMLEVSTAEINLPIQSH